MRQQQGRLQRFAWLNQAVRNAHLQRLFAGDTSSGKNEVERTTLSDHPGQADGTQIDERNAEAAVEHAKNGVTGSNAQVAPQCQFETASNCISLYRSQYRLA